MGELGVSVFDRREEELAADCRVDREDALQLAEGAAASASLQDSRSRVVDLLRRCAARVTPEAFEILEAYLQDRVPELEDSNRVLLRPGARGLEVARLRSALGAAADLFGDRRLDPGPGTRYDAGCQAAVRSLQEMVLAAPSGALDTLTLLRLNYLLTESQAPLLDLDRPAAPPAGVQLDFYPGDQDRLLVVRQRGQVVDVYAMRGGPAEGRPDDRSWVDPHFSWAPTPAGTYTLAGSGAHVTASWKFSQIPFGAELREQAGEIEFRPPGGEWRPATGPRSVFANAPEVKRFEREDFLERGVLPARYELSDFGHRAIYLRDRQGRIAGHLIHPTTLGEQRYGEDVPLFESHGCEHMRPHDLDEALAKGYLRSGVRFRVHAYTEEAPGDVQAWLAARGRSDEAGQE
jgi:hypothetical protein